MKLFILLKKILSCQKGMTLLESIVAIGLSGLVLPVAASSVFHIVVDSEVSRNHIVALQDIWHAADIIKNDVHLAQTSNLDNGAPPVNSLNLSWVDAGTGVSHSVSYYLSGTKLVRDNGTTVSSAGRYISSVEFSLTANILKVKLVSSPGFDSRRSQQMTYLFALG